MTKFFFLVLFLCSFDVFGQYKIVDAETKAPISYGHVKLAHNSNGIIATYGGEFKLDKTYSVFDTLMVSCIGYETKRVIVKALHEFSIIELTPKSNRLNALNITAKKSHHRNKKIGVIKNPKTKFFDYAITAYNGVERAIWIPNKYNISGVLKSVNVYVTDVGYPDAHFRIHVYECSPFKVIPGKELTMSNVISSGVNGNEWVNIELEQQHINIAENGCFIGVEWFDSPKAKSYKDTLRKKGVTYDDGKRVDTTYAIVRRGNGVVLGSISEKYRYAKNKIWYRASAFATWINQSTSYGREERFYIPDTLASGHVHIPDENNSYCQLPCINIDVSFPKEKIKLEYTKPKNRKLNRIERVKENTFKYPQSDVSELFSSLIKAFEQDDNVYVLKYLCVYKESELKTILDQLQFEKNAQNIIPKEDKAKIIATLKDIQSKLETSELDKIDAKQFELKVGSDSYNLIVDKGLWKINPYRYKLFK